MAKQKDTISMANPTILRAPRALAKLRDRLDALACRRVLVLTGASRRFLPELTEALGDRDIHVFDGARVHVPLELVERAADTLRAVKADTLITLGGGSVTGLGKALRLRAEVRFVAVPTTYSGSEMTAIYGITSGAGKQTGRDERVRPDFIVHDPAFTSALPIELTTTSLVNALSHPVSALSTDSLSGPAREQALTTVRELVSALDHLVAAPDNQAARAAALEAAAMAAGLLDGGTMGLQHRAAHLLGGRFNLDHGATHSVLLPQFLARLDRVRPELSRALARAAGIAELARHVFDLLVRAGCSSSLQQLEVDGPALRELSAELHSGSSDDPDARDALRELLVDAYLGRRPSTATRREDWQLDHPISIHGPALAACERVVIAVHGRGSTADQAIRRANELLGDAPGVTVVAPQGEDRRWYSGRYNASLDELGAELPRALSALAHVVGIVRERAPASCPVFLFGFSQGACLVLEFIARATSGGIAGAAAIAGARIGPPDVWHTPAHDLSNMSILLGIASRDPWVARDDVERTAAQLVGAGANVTIQHAPGARHELTALQRVAARELLLGRGDRLGSPGFDNVHASEALPGALPVAQNSPRRVPYGLHAEQINGTGFVARRHENLRTWFYRIRPSAQHRRFEPLEHATLRDDFSGAAPEPNLTGHGPLAVPPPGVATDFVDGLATYGGAGSPALRRGYALHLYAANRSMDHRAFYNADGDLLIIPEHGRLTLLTECGALDVDPGHVAIAPRGVKFSVLLHGPWARGYVAEVFGRHFTLPERGPVGANGLADPRHFRAPTCWHEDRLAPGYRLTAKLGGRLYDTTQDYSAYDVVAWHGNYTPLVYDLQRFSPVSNVRFDHPDPSIYTVLSAPLDELGAHSLDFVIFPPRWDPTEHTLRPPFFHRNATTEFNGIIREPVRKNSPFVPGCYFLTPSMTAHGVRHSAIEAALARSDDEADRPHRLSDRSLWFQFETTLPLSLTAWARQSPNRVADWHLMWGEHRSRFDPTRRPERPEFTGS